MKKYESYARVLPWFMALALSALLAACGGGRDPILGAGGVLAPVPTPSVLYTSPSDLAPGVPTNRKISATFSQAVDATTIVTSTAPDTFTLKKTLTPGNIPGAVTYDTASRSATFTPASALDIDTDYTATITTAVKNVAGAAMLSNEVWSFKTGLVTDVTPPRLLSTDPADGANNVPVNQAIHATFSELIDTATTTFTVTCTAPVGCSSPAGVVSYVGTTATFTPSSVLQSGATYSAVITATDLAGNVWVTGGIQPANPWTFTTSATAAVHLGPAPVVLGATQPYGVLSNTGVTLGGSGITGLRVVGDVGISPAGACVGCVAAGGSISGVLENGTVAASDAMVALAAAYNDAIGRTTNVCTLIGSGILTTNPSVACGGTANGTFKPGLYWSSTSIEIPAGGTITLDAQNDPSAVFIFQSESTINSIGGNTHVVLLNQAKAANVFWVAKSSATIGGTNSDFAGTVLALVAVTVNTGTDMVGRALARSAAVTVQDQAKITVPTP